MFTQLLLELGQVVDDELVFAVVVQSDDSVRIVDFRERHNSDDLVSLPRIFAHYSNLFAPKSRFHRNCS